MEIKISQISKRIGVRSLKPKGVERLKTKISEVGYLPEKPVIVTPDGNGGFILIDGAHRVAALEELGIDSVEALIDEDLITEALRLRRARLANEVSETVVPTTFVDDAELIWRLADEEKTQTEIGSVFGWSREKVKNYNALRNICSEAWRIIGTTFEEIVPHPKNGVVPEVGTTVPFTEGLLRSILPLTPDQQLELISGLATGEIKTKNKFNDLAKKYRIRNDMFDYAMTRLSGLTDNFIETTQKAIYSGSYDKDWETEHRPKLNRLIESIIAEWEEKSGIQLIHGDFYQEVLAIEENSIDLILTDPPFGISGYGGATTKGPDIVTANFDEDADWDTQTYEQIEESANAWMKEWSRILKSGGSLIAFCDKFLISHLYKLCKQYGLKPKNVIIWYKYNAPGAALGRKNLKSDAEFMLWAVKPGTPYTFNDIDSEIWDRGTWLKAAICGGAERIKDKRGEVLHPTQKPLSVLKPLIEVFSNRGDIVFDGFAGVGSTGAGAKELKRKFLGIELNEAFFNAMRDRLNDE